jgi:hypothetical protein
MATYIDDSGNLVDSNAPVSYDDQVAMLLSWGTPPDQIQGLIGTRESVAEGQKAQAQEIYERTGEAPSYSESVGFTPGAPAWLNPQDYTSSGYAAPYTQAEITGQVDPSNFRIMNGQLYASAKGAGDLSGGEYLINPNTGRFYLDASGKPVGVTYPREKPGTFESIMETAIPLFIAAASIPVLGGMGAELAGLGAAEGGFGLTGASGAGGSMGAGSSLQLAPSAGTIGGYGSVSAPSLATGLGVGSGGVLGAGALSPETVAYIEAMKAGTGYGLNASQVPNLAEGLDLAAPSGLTGIDSLLSSLGSALKTPLGQLGARGGLGLLSGAGQQAAVPQMQAGGGSGTYAPKGQVDYTPILNLLAPRQIARNTNSLLG